MHKGTASSLSELREARREMQQALDARLLPNVFHYPGERWLYERGTELRGLSDLKEGLRGKLAEIAAEVQQRVERRRTQAEDFVAAALLALSLLQLREVVRVLAAGRAEPGDLISLGVVLVVAVIIAVGYVRMRRRD